MDQPSTTDTAPAVPGLLRVAFLISGSGSTLANVLALSAAGRLSLQVVGVAASRDCAGLEHARAAGVPWAIVERGEPFDAQDYSRRMTAQLDEWRPQLIVMGGFLTLYLIPPQYSGRVINIHPSLLPAFGGQGMYGERVHEAVLASGAKVTGCSVHFVDHSYDTGPVIAQRAVPVLQDDDAHTLGERVRAAERELLPAVLQWFAEGRVELSADGTVAVSDRKLLPGA